MSSKRGPRGPYSMVASKVDTLCRLLRVGIRIGKACELAGISGRTYRHWMVQGAGEVDPEYVEFRRRIHEAQASPVEKLGETFWLLLDSAEKEETVARMVMWGLERMGGLSARSEVAATVEATVDATAVVHSKVDGALTPEVVAQMTPDQVAAALRALAAPDTTEQENENATEMDGDDTGE